MPQSFVLLSVILGRNTEISEPNGVYENCSYGNEQQTFKNESWRIF